MRETEEVKHPACVVYWLQDTSKGENHSPCETQRQVPPC